MQRSAEKSDCSHILNAHLSLSSFFSHAYLMATDLWFKNDTTLYYTRPSEGMDSMDPTRERGGAKENF